MAEQNKTSSSIQFVEEAIQQQQAEQDQLINDIAIGNKDLEQKILDKQIRLADRAARRSRDTSEQVQDIAASVGIKGSIGLGEFLYGAVDKLTQGSVVTGYNEDGSPNIEKTSLDRASKPIVESIGSKGTVAEQFSKARQFVDTELLSDPLSYSKQQVQKIQQKHAQGSATRVDELIEAGHSELMAKAVDEGSSFLNTLEAFKDNPIAAIDTALESLPQMFLGGTAGRSAVKQLVAGKSTKEAAEFMASEAGKEAVNKAATRAGISTTAATEGISNGLSAKAEVLGMSHDELLKESPTYQALIKQGMSPEAARAEVSDKVFDVTAAISGTVGALASKVTGAASFEGKLFIPNGKIASLVTKPVGGALSEGVEETIQGGAGQLAENVAKQIHVDPKQDILEGTGEAAATGLVAGTVSGGGVGSVTSAANVVAGGVDEAIAPVRDAVKQTKEVNEALKTQEASDAARDTESESYDAATAFDVAIDPSQIPTESEARKKHIGELNNHLSNIEDNVLEQAAALDAMPQETEEQKELHGQALEKLHANIKHMEQSQERLDILRNKDKVTPATADEKISNVTPENKQELLGSVPNLSTEQLKTLAESESLDDTEKTRISNHLKTREVIEQVEAISSNDVHGDIVEGSKGSIGIKQHQQRIADAVDAGDQKGATKAMKAFREFARNHSTKVRKIKQAFNAHVKSPNSPQAVNLSEAVESEYGLKIHKGSNKSGLIDRMDLEVQALKAADTESLQLAQSKFAPKATKASKPQATQPEVDVAPVVEKTEVAESTQAPVEDSNPITQYTTKLKQDMESALSDGDTSRAAELATEIDHLENGKVVPIMSDASRVTEGNKVASNFDTKVNRKNLLHTVKDIFKVLKDTTFTQEALTENQNSALEKIQEFESKFSAAISKVVTRRGKSKKGIDFSHQDYTQYLLNENDDLEANVKSAIGMVSLNWLTTRAGKTIYNDNQSINNILGVSDEDAVVHPVAAELLSDVGVVATGLAESLGKDVIKLLGIKTNENADGSEQAKLEMSMGNLVIHALAEQGLVVLSEIDNKSLDIFRETKSDNPNATTTFVRVQSVRNEETGFNVLSPELVQLATTLKDSEDVMGELFGTQSYETKPQLKEPKKSDVVEMVKGTFNKIPARIREAIAKHQKRAVVNKTNVTRPFFFLSEKAQLVVAGANENIEELHVNDRKSAEAINESIVRSIQHMKDHMERVGNKPFFFRHYVTKQMRMMMDSNTVNMQSNKIHRHLMGHADWNVTIDQSNPEHMQQFYTAVAESLGIGVDKLTARESIAQLALLSADPVIKKAVEAINIINSGTLDEGAPSAETSFDRQDLEDAIVAAVKKGGENVYTLDGLVALAAYEKADGKPFETNLFREVDGVTNGVIIGLFQLAAGSVDVLKQQLERGGMFFDETQNWSEWYKKLGNNDSYQDMAIDWAEELDTLDQQVLEDAEVNSKKRKFAVKLLKSNTNALNAMRNLVGSFVEDNKVTSVARKLTKNPLMVTNYGAGISGTRATFAESILAGIYTGLAKNKDNPTELARVSAELSQMLGQEFVINADNALTFTLDNKNHKKFTTLMDAYYGTALEGAINNKFGSFIEKRTELNNALNIGFIAFNTMYQRRIQEEESKLGKTLTREQKLEIVRELQEVVPSFKSPLAEQADDSIVVMKEDKVRSKNKEHRVESTFDTSVTKRTKTVNEDGSISESQSTTKSKRAHIAINEYEDGGVSGTILGIHSIDAATMTGILEDFSALNVHDAAAFNLLDVMEGTEAINKSFYETLSKYNMREEVQAYLERAVKAVKSSKLDRSTFAREIVARGLIDKDSNIDDFLKMFDMKTKEANAIREELLSQLQRVQQYNPGEGGQYEVSPVEDTSNATAEQEVDIVTEDLKQFFKSANKDIDPDNFGATTTATVNNMNQQNVFQQLDKLGNVQETPEHSTYLSKLLHSISSKIEQPLKLHLRKQGNENYGGTQGNDVFINEGMGTLANGTQMSMQEVYLHELVHVVTRQGVEGVSWAKREIVKLFNEVEKHIKPEHFLNRNANGEILDLHGNVITAQSAGYASELAAATERYDYIFNNKSTTASGKNSYLHEFVALGLTNAAFRKALSNIKGKTVPRSYRDMGFVEAIMSIFERISDWLTGKITQSSDLTADKKLMVLAEQLAGIDYRKKSVIYSNMDKVTDAIHTGLAKFVAEPIIKLANSRRVQNSKSSIVKNVGGIVSKLPDIDYAGYSKTMQQVTRRLNITKDNIISSLATEAIGSTAGNNAFHILLRKSSKLIDQARTHIKTGVIKQVNNVFHTELSKRDKNALNATMLKTDISALTSAYSWTELQKFMEDPEALATEINNLEKQFKQYGNRQHYFRKMSESLGQFMAIGKFREVNTPFNAYAIANEDGTGNKPLPSDDVLIELIDRVTSLQALRYTSAESKLATADIIAREHTVDATNNGVTFLAQMQQHNKEKSQEMLFNGNPTLMVKGFTKEIYNPNISVVVAPLSEEANLLREGYQREANPLPRDPHNPVAEPVYRFTSRDNLVGTWDSGIASFTNKTAKGTDLIEVYAQQGNVNASQEARTEGQRIFKIKGREVQKVYSAKATHSNESILAPIFNDMGEISGYRYLMDEYTKNTILEKDNSFDNVIGAMEAAISDKVNTQQINSDLVRQAKADYDEKYSSDPDNYVVVGKNATRDEYRELYQMMPYEMRQEIRNVWGQDNMYVPAELVTMMFGQRKVSAANSLIKTQAFQNFNRLVMDKFDINIGRGIKGFENVWQEMVKTVKDIIVIKSGVVLLGNVLSNMVLLKTMGVGTKSLFRDHGIAITYAKNYQKDITEMEALERELEINPNATDRKRKEVMIARLKDNLANNPVKEMIDAGIYQSIVEDVDVEDDQFTYKSKLQEWLTPKFVEEGKVPKLLTDVGHNLIISHQTSLYKQLRDATQLSDFVARYTLHQYNMEKGMSKDESFKMIVDTFINYDLPTHKGIQYANDMGLLMFTKFFIRIQKVIAYLATKKTANLAAVVTLQGMLDVDVEDIADSIISPDNVANKIHTPYDVATNLLDIPLVNLVN